MRAAFELRLGARVVEAITQPQGFSPGLAARLRLEDGRRVFLKAVSEEANPDTPDIHRREARILAVLPATAPIARLLWSYDEMGWVALCLEDVDGRHPGEPWTEADLDLVIGTVEKMSRDLTPSPVTTVETVPDFFVRTVNGWRNAMEREEQRLDQWELRNLVRLAELERRAPEMVAGDGLVHCDVRTTCSSPAIESLSSTGRGRESGRRGWTWWRWPPASRCRAGPCAKTFSRASTCEVFPPGRSTP